MFIDYIPYKECDNPDVYYTCHKCGKCGREFQKRDSDKWIRLSGI